VTHSIAAWAQNYLQAAVSTYQEVTPSGEGIRMWGFAEGQPLHKKFTLTVDGKDMAVELFRKTNKALTITGYTLDPAIHELQNVDKVFDWALVWGERRKAQEQKEPIKGNSFDSSGCRYSIDEIEQIVREGAPAGTNRSDVFHAIIGHYVGCGWQAERILEHLQQYPDGIGSRYLREERLGRGGARSVEKDAQLELPLSGGNSSGWTGQEVPPEVEAPTQEKEPCRSTSSRMTTKMMILKTMRLMTKTLMKRHPIPACRVSTHTVTPIHGHLSVGSLRGKCRRWGRD